MRVINCGQIPKGKRLGQSLTKTSQLVQPSAALLCVFLENSPVKPSPQNKWLEPTLFKLQGAREQKMLSCFSQIGDLEILLKPP